jgi:hypothetical protein
MAFLVGISSSVSKEVNAVIYAVSRTVPEYDEEYDGSGAI